MADLTAFEGIESDQAEKLIETAKAAPPRPVAPEDGEKDEEVAKEAASAEEE